MLGALNMLSIIPLIVFPYLVFIFFGESLNPFFKPKWHAKRSAWRFGRAMGLAALLGMTTTIVLLNLFSRQLPIAAFYGAIVFAILASLFCGRKINRFFR